MERIVNITEHNKSENTMRKQIRMLENKIFNLLNINPIVKIATRHFRDVSLLQKLNCEIKSDKAIMFLTSNNYNELINMIGNDRDLDTMKVRQTLEEQYMLRTNNTLNDFSKLILARHNLAKRAGYTTYYKYINRGKFDNSETIKDLIITLDKQINLKTRKELEKIHKFCEANRN
ncbi:MAG: hypothetical protein Dasosvirus21_3 [Dasosvirus sp.]|uniref:Peptidase M3A/M3B catalytic domain-containing protein n=1 Tax=Dasosvirus sp. TaxID=2487764 RepID=A0A3G4ZRX7_9VIRU|nr:MAG: hypothetical protein Dasosvirus21_3 [Dasosvirus sp.]